MQHPENDISSRFSLTQQRLIETYLATGNPSNPKFRRLCYAANANAFHRYLELHSSRIDSEQCILLGKLVASILHEKEREISGTDSLSPFIDKLFETRAAGRSNIEVNALPVPAAPERRHEKRWKWSTMAAGIFFGASTVFLGLKICDALGLIYIHNYPENFLQLEKFNRAVESLSPSIESALVALRKAEQELTSAIETHGINSMKPDDIFDHFRNIRDVLPDFFESYKTYFPRNSTMIVRLSQDGGYKILFESEICGALISQHPEMNDKSRNSNYIFCNYFGVWNDKGKNL